ncbi:MAG TPA: hypothetical protein VLM91_26170 [Candidatus Methylomirabilis sp.]|nr:hypothetical protein [Candidatus Methylomirabilis sp.]
MGKEPGRIPMLDRGDHRMPNGDETRRGRKWKQKIASEMAVYWIFVRYLSILFGMFIAHQRLILAQHAISLEEFVRRNR